MKKILTLFALLLLLNSCCNAPTDAPWRLVWQDEFNTNTIDTTKWVKIPRGPSDWNNYMSDYDSLYALKDGKLILRGIKNYTQTQDTAEYITGGVFTKGKRLFQFGRIEIYAKLGSAQGFWPAFWMLPGRRNAWPDGGEIDIMEHLSHDSVIYQTVHSRYTHARTTEKKPKAGNTSLHKFEDWNLYALEMYQDSLVFFINDKKTHSYPRVETKIEQQFPYSEQGFYLLLDAQLGGGWVGKVDPEQLPVEMEIDYVRFYQK